MSQPGALVGREAELSVARAALRAIVDGRASTLVVEGEAGIGKTRLVHSLLEEAEPLGATALYGQAHPFERVRPFAVVAAALRLTPRSRDPRRAALGSLLSGAEPPAAVGDVQYRIVDEVVDLVEKRRAPTTRCCWWPRTCTGLTTPACSPSCRWSGGCRSRRCSWW